MQHFSAGHNVREEGISVGHRVINAGHCPMSGVYFLACECVKNLLRNKAIALRPHVTIAMDGLFWCVPNMSGTYMRVMLQLSPYVCCCCCACVHFCRLAHEKWRHSRGKIHFDMT